MPFIGALEGLLRSPTKDLFKDLFRDSFEFKESLWLELGDGEPVEVLEIYFFQGE